MIIYSVLSFWTAQELSATAINRCEAIEVLRNGVQNLQGLKKYEIIGDIQKYQSAVCDFANELITRRERELKLSTNWIS